MKRSRLQCFGVSDPNVRYRRQVLRRRASFRCSGVLLASKSFSIALHHLVSVLRKYIDVGSVSLIVFTFYGRDRDVSFFNLS